MATIESSALLISFFEDFSRIGYSIMFGPHVNRTHATNTTCGKKERLSITAHIKAARAEAAAVDFNARVFQIFIAGPRNMAITLRDEEADELREYLRNYKLQVISHGTYTDYPWYDKSYSAKFIRMELEMCERAGISGLVIHLGKPEIEKVMHYIPRLITDTRNVLIFLEVPHVKPEHSHYETPEKLAALFREIRRHDPTLCKFGLCIDTAHLWSSGVDLQSFEDAEDWLRRLEAVANVIPPDRIIFHLNDSYDKLGSGADHHAPLLGGKIWGEYTDRPQLSGLAAFVDYIVRNNTITILERKSREMLLDDYSVLDRMSTIVRPIATI